MTPKPFRAGYVRAAVALTVAAMSAAQSPGFVQAVARVGTDTQLPLERIASSGHLARHFARAEGLPREHASLAAAVDTRAGTPNDALHRSAVPLPLSRRAPGYW